MKLEHHYALEIEWTGNRGTGTADYKSYGRDHVVRAEGKHELIPLLRPRPRGERGGQVGYFGIERQGLPR